MGRHKKFRKLRNNRSTKYNSNIRIGSQREHFNVAMHKQICNAMEGILAAKQQRVANKVTLISSHTAEKTLSSYYLIGKDNEFSSLRISDHAALEASDNQNTILFSSDSLRMSRIQDLIPDLGDWVENQLNQKHLNFVVSYEMYKELVLLATIHRHWNHALFSKVVSTDTSDSTGAQLGSIYYSISSNKNYLPLPKLHLLMKSQHLDYYIKTGLVRIFKLTPEVYGVGVPDQTYDLLMYLLPLYREQYQKDCKYAHSIYFPKKLLKEAWDNDSLNKNMLPPEDYQQKSSASANMTDGTCKESINTEDYVIYDLIEQWQLSPVLISKEDSDSAYVLIPADTKLVDYSVNSKGQLELSPSLMPTGKSAYIKYPAEGLNKEKLPVIAKGTKFTKIRGKNQVVF